MHWGERRAVRLGLAAALVLCLARPAPAEPGDPQLVARIFDGLGVRAQIAAIVPSATEQLLAAPMASDADRRALGRIVAREFAPERLERMAQHAFLTRLAATEDPERSLAHARRAADWLTEPLATRLHAAMATVAPETCTPEQASPTRRRLVRALERETGGMARVQRHARTVARSMLDAAEALLPGSQTIEREAQPPVASPREGLTRRTCRYADLSTAELGRAVAFLQGDAGAWLHDAVSQSLDEALEVVARRTAHELIRHFEGREPQTPVHVAGVGLPRAG